MMNLDGAGKPTFLYQLKLEERVDTVPTLGFNVECIQYHNVSFTVWDVALHLVEIRPLWNHYFSNAQGLIFMVDSDDGDRLAEARDELHRLLGEAELQQAKVLVFANRPDLRRAAGVAEVTEKLELTRRQASCFVERCCSTTGAGLHEGLDWLAAAFGNARIAAPSIIAIK